MRHLRSLLYALVLAPTIWTLSAVGFTQNLTGRARGDGTIEVLSGFLLLLLAGAAYAILLLPRLSPAGPAAVGALYLVVCVWVLIDPGSFHGMFSPAVSKPGFDLTLPADGLAALLAVPLLCTTLSRRRWHESRREPLEALANTIVWPFARPARPGTLVVPGVTDLPTPDATQVLPSIDRPSTATQVLPTQAIPAKDTTETSRTQVLPPKETAEASRTQVLPSKENTETSRTQVLPAQASPAPPSDAPAPGEPEGDRTQVIKTQVIPPLPSSAPASPAPASPAPASPASASPAPASPAPVGGDATQVVPSLADLTRALPQQSPTTPQPPSFHETDGPGGPIEPDADEPDADEPADEPDADAETQTLDGAAPAAGTAEKPADIAEKPAADKTS